MLNAPCWIIDILPKQVPKDSPGHCFTIEDYFLKEQLAAIKRKHLNVILKLNCHMDIAIEDETNPNLARLAEMVKERYVYIMLDDSMLSSIYYTKYDGDWQPMTLTFRYDAFE